jgi:vesicle transport through interaction with t-SNAREs protein 1
LHAPPSAGFNPHSRLLSDYDSMQRTNAHLDRTQLLASEAEQIGATVLSDLRRQREQIERASQALQETDQDIERSNKLLKKMINRAFANRAVSVLILVILVVCVSLVIWIKFIPT